MQRIIEQTEDGSATLYVPELNEHYHSVKGARTESQHIFIDMGLKASAAPCPHILEAGFGTGLNALLTLQEAERTGRPVRLTPTFRLLKLRRDLTSWQADDERPPLRCDVVYFDAFAPEKQPALWTPAVFRNLYRCLTPGGILTTYCAKGAVRRLMQDIGFRMERLPGPPGGKREILRATKPNDVPENMPELYR